MISFSFFLIGRRNGKAIITHTHKVQVPRFEPRS